MAYIEPINEYILLKAEKDVQKTDTGMVIAHGKGDKIEAVAVRARVESMSEKVRVKSEVKVGDTVFAAKWEGQHAYLGANHYILVKHTDILGIIKEK